MDERAGVLGRILWGPARSASLSVTGCSESCQAKETRCKKVKRAICTARRKRSLGEPGETVSEVGDQVQVRSNGGTPTAQKYAGEKGRVTMISSGVDAIILDVRIGDYNFDTVLEEGDLGATVLMGLLSGLEAQSELSRLLDELSGEGSEF